MPESTTPRVTAGSTRCHSTSPKVPEAPDAQGIKDVEAGPAELGDVHARPRPARNRKPTQQDAEDQLQQETHPEHGDAVGDVRVQARAEVPPGAPALRRVGAEGNADAEAHEQAEEGQLDGGRQLLHDGLADLLLEDHGLPEVESDQVAEVFHVLDSDWLVEPQLLLLLVDHLLGRVAAQHGAHGVPRHDPQHHEHEGQHDEDHRDGEEETGDDVAEEVSHGKEKAVGSPEGDPTIARFIS